MRIPRLFHPHLLSSHSTITLDPEQSRYLAKVLRLESGAPLTLFDGRGGEYACTIEAARRDGVTIRVNRHVDRDVESPLQTTLAQGISRGERMDYTLRKAVELGVSTIQPLFTEYCQVQLKEERLAKRLRHWQGVVNAACEQSGRNKVPEVLTPTPLSDYISTLPQGLRLLLDPAAETRLRDLADPGSAITLFAGPEGGLSRTEIELLTNHGCIGVRLGPRVLRTETAALAALAALQNLWGDF